MNDTRDMGVEETFKAMGLESPADRKRFQFEPYDDDYSSSPAAEIFISSHT